jgi:hypothetical protein
MSSSSQVIVEVHNDSRYSTSYEAILRVLRELHPGAFLSQSADVTYGRDNRKVRGPRHTIKTPPVGWRASCIGRLTHAASGWRAAGASYVCATRRTQRPT